MEVNFELTYPPPISKRFVAPFFLIFWKIPIMFRIIESRKVNSHENQEVRSE